MPQSIKDAINSRVQVARDAINNLWNKSTQSNYAPVDDSFGEPSIACNHVWVRGITRSGKIKSCKVCGHSESVSDVAWNGVPVK